MKSSDKEIARLKELAKTVRKTAVKMVHSARASHLGGALSMTDILTVLYGAVLKVDPKDPQKNDRDRFILSKGHACSAYYAVLCELGFFTREWIDSYCQNGSLLAGHATHCGVPGIEISTGSLGHGLPVGCGMALAAKLDRKTNRVYVLLGDGECDEGSIWEAALFAAHHKLGNLTVIIDYNKIQSLGSVKEVLGLEPFADKWKSFGWSTLEVDGHSIEELLKAFDVAIKTKDAPTCIIAHTVKGKGVSFMEHKLAWHYKSPSDDELAKAMQEIDAAK